MDERRLLLAMAERLYTDIRFVTEQSPVQIVDDDGAKAYNSLLARVRVQFSNLPPIADFHDWSPRSIKYKDALIVAGQLYAMIKIVVDPAPVRHPVAPPGVGAPSQSPSDTQIPTAQRQFGVRPPTGVGNLRRPAPQGSVDTGRGSSLHTPLPDDTPNPALHRPRTESSSHVPVGDRESFDTDLYGTRQPPKRNDDGTIPFTLD